MNDPMQPQILRIHQDLSYTRNARGCLSKMLAVVGDHHGKFLACDFAERVLLNAEGLPRRIIEPVIDVYLRLFNRIRLFLVGDAAIGPINDLIKELYQIGPIATSFPEFDRLIAGEISQPAFLAHKVYCQREIETLGETIHVRYQPSAKDVAYAASYTVARIAAGPDWDAVDHDSRSTARTKGHDASHAETQWQIQHLIRYIDTSAK